MGGMYMYSAGKSDMINVAASQDTWEVMQAEERILIQSQRKIYIRIHKQMHVSCNLHNTSIVFQFETQALGDSHETT